MNLRALAVALESNSFQWFLKYGKPRRGPCFWNDQTDKIGQRPTALVCRVCPSFYRPKQVQSFSFSVSGFGHDTSATKLQHHPTSQHPGLDHFSFIENSISDLGLDFPQASLSRREHPTPFESKVARVALKTCHFGSCSRLHRSWRGGAPRVLGSLAISFTTSTVQFQFFPVGH